MLSVSEYIQIAKANGYLVFEGEKYAPYNLNIVGVRKSNSRLNHFDDFINIYYEDKDGWVQRWFPATTLPGTHHLLKPMNVKGTAILKAGQYINTYMKGSHQGKYGALVQLKSVTVLRDNDKDSYPEIDGEEETGFFGINIHRASFGAKLVGPNSAGCQVIKNADDYKEFMYYIDKALGYRENSFTYTLVEI